MSEERPVVSGLLALGGVGLVVGLLVSGAALGATQVLGLGGGGDGGGTATAQQSMDLPTPVPTDPASGPLVTLVPVPTPEGATAATPSEPTTPTATAAPAISLSASTTDAAAGEMVTLSGVYPGGEGATLVVERYIGDTWTSFADVSTSVSRESFSTYIRTSQTGENIFRVRDAANDLASNEVKFTIR